MSGRPGVSAVNGATATLCYASFCLVGETQNAATKGEVYAEMKKDFASDFHLWWR